MKSLTALVLLVLLCACKKETAQPDTAPHSVALNEATAPATFSEELGGLWISDSYLAGIAKTKSIYANKDYDTEMLGFSLYADSLVAGHGAIEGFSSHEGGFHRPLVYNPATKRFDYDNSRRAEYDDKMYFSVYPSGKNLLDISYTKPAKKERYRRIGLATDTPWALDYELNHMLFEGTYTDSLSGKKVTFSAKGSVSGIEGKAHYLLLLDFGEGLEFDTVFISKNEEQEIQETYHFKIKGSTIYLYTASDPEGHFEYTISPNPAYILKKQ